MIVQNLIINFVDRISLQDISIASTRDNKKRHEIPASILYSKCKLNIIDEDIHKIKNLLINNQNSDCMWDEYAYGFEDENIGYSGIVTTSFVLLGLVEYYKKFEDEEVLDCLIKSADAIYFQENNGYIKKAKENKSDVLNTNLLGAIAIKEISEILPKSSTRKKLYDELTRRVIKKVLSYQSLKGEFPYHFESKSVPILYQAMVSAQLRNLLKYYDDEIIHKSILDGNKALIKYFQDNGYVNWDKANNCDKKGAMWVYSFSLASVDDDKLIDKIINILQVHSTDGIFHRTDIEKIEDKFFSAWMIFGLVWSLDKKEIKNNFTLITKLKFSYLKLEYSFTYLKFIIKYIKNKLYNIPFNSGALENRYWIKK
jgi:hypothetical protein